MAVEVIDWPASLPPAMETSWFLGVSTKSPGAGLDGRRQVIFRENRVWQGRIGLTQLWGLRAAVLQAFLDDIRGSYGLIRFPVRNSQVTAYTLPALSDFYAKFGLTSSWISNGIPFSSGMRFSSGTGFALPDRANPTVMADVPAGSSLIGLNGFLGRTLGVGAYFSVNGFLYRVAANADGLVRFNPPLREALTAGVTVETIATTIVVRLSQDAQARLNLAQRQIGTVPSFDVEEAFDR